MRSLIAALGWTSASVSAAAVYAGLIVLVRSLDLAATAEAPDERSLRPGDLYVSPEARDEERRLLRRRGLRILGIWVLSFLLATAAYLYLQPEA